MKKSTDVVWKTRLPEDNPEAVHVLLNILHGCFNRVPSLMTIDLLFEITVVTEKYDMVGVLGPYAQEWLAMSRAEANDKPSTFKSLQFTS